MIAGSIAFGLMAAVSWSMANIFSLPLAKRLGNARMLLLRGLWTCAAVIIPAMGSLGQLSHWRAALMAFAVGVFGYLPPLAFTHGARVSRISIVSPIAGTAPFVT